MDWNQLPFPDPLSQAQWVGVQRPYYRMAAFRAGARLGKRPLIGVLYQGIAGVQRLIVKAKTVCLRGFRKAAEEGTSAVKGRFEVEELRYQLEVRPVQSLDVLHMTFNGK